MKRQYEYKIGTVQAVVVAEHTGIIMPVHTVTREQEERISFSGNTVVSENTFTHLNEVIVPLVDSILVQLNVAKPSWCITIPVPAAIATSIQGWQINGHSFDLPFFLSLLSSALRIAIRQDILYTGALFTSNGEVGLVESLAEKFQAARENRTINGFCYPSIDSDSSLKQLKPTEYDNTTGELRACRGRISLIEVLTIVDVLEKTCTEQALLAAALKSEYYGEEKSTPETVIQRAVHILTKDSRTRFLHVFEQLIIEKQQNRIQEFINLVLDHQIVKKQYPVNLGNDIMKLLGSFPPALLKTSVPSLLISQDRMAAFEELISSSDCSDIDLLRKLNMYSFGIHAPIQSDFSKDKSSRSTELLLDHIIAEADPEHLELEITLPLYLAREQFYLEISTVDSYDELIQLLSRFYRHMYYQRHHEIPIPDEGRITTEVINLAKKAYAPPHTFEELVRNARKGTNGGLRTILDILTDHLKQEAIQSHLLRVFNDAINPLDHDQKTELMILFMERFKDSIPIDFWNENPAYYTENLDEMVTIILNARKPLIDTFRKL